MLLLRSAMRQPRNGNLNYSNKNAPRLLRRCIANIRIVKASHTERLITIIPCYVISKDCANRAESILLELPRCRQSYANKFPRLLAEREIIANALFTNDVLEMACAKSIGKGTNNI